MYLLLIFVVLSSGAAMISLKFNKRIEETLSMWIFVIILILYLFAMVGLLEIGVYTVTTIGLISTIFCFYNIYRNRKIFIENVLTPGFVIFTILFIIAWWAQRGRMLTSWDEFSHWGTVVKNMYIFDTLGNHPEATTTFRGYPPATALFEYFWVKLSGYFSEGNLYRAMNILYFSLMMPIFINVKHKNFSKIVIRVVFILILPLAFFQDFYTNIMVDAILGVMFANVLITYYANKLCTFKIINISLTLFVLTLTKSPGFGLAIIAILVIAIDLLFAKREELKLYINSGTKINTLKRIVLILCPIFAAIISKKSWALYLKITKTNVAWNTSEVGLQNFKALFTGNALHYQFVTINNFFNAITELFLTNYILKLSLMGWIVVLIAISTILITFVCNEEEKGRYKLGVIIVFVGGVIYTFSLLILYVFTYSQYEATNLASYSRYTSTYLLGVLIFLVVTICLKEKDYDTKFKQSCTIFILLFFLLIINVTPVISNTILAPYNIKKTIEKRRPYAPITKINGLLNPKTDKVYIISAATNGYDYWLSRYNITPIKTNLKLESWSLGKPYYKGDIWTKDISAKEWAEKLKNEYTYVYIFKTNDGFNKTYGEIFEGGNKAIKKDTLYYVKKNNGSVVLEKVE